MGNEEVDTRLRQRGIEILVQDLGVKPADFYNKDKVKGIYLHHVREKLRRHLNAFST